MSLLFWVQVFSCWVWWWCTCCGFRFWMWWTCTWTTSAPQCVLASSCPSTTDSHSCSPLLASSSASSLVFSSSSLAEPSRFITTDVSPGTHWFKAWHVWNTTYFFFTFYYHTFNIYVPANIIRAIFYYLQAKNGIFQKSSNYTTYIIKEDVPNGKMQRCSNMPTMKNSM